MTSLTSPLVSVVIPCRNACTTLAATLASVLAQSHRALEVLVIDDGSEDGSAKLVRACADERLKLIQQPQRGASAARNAGLAEASGALVQFLDADDLLKPGKIAAQVAQWRLSADAERDVYACGYDCLRLSPTDLHERRLRPRALTAPMGWLMACWLDGAMLPPHAWLLPMTLCRSIGPWDESLLQNQDGEYFTRALLRAGRIHHLQDRLCAYRVGRPGSISTQRTAAVRASRLRSFDLCASALLTVDRSDAATEAVAALYMTLVIDCAVAQPALADAAYAKARRYSIKPLINGRGRSFRCVASLLGWQHAARLAASWQRFTCRYRTD